VRGKIFGSVLPCRRRGLFLAHRLVHEFRGLGGNNLQHRAADRAHRQRLQNVASRYTVCTHSSSQFVWLRSFPANPESSIATPACAERLGMTMSLHLASIRDFLFALRQAGTPKLATTTP